MNRTVVLLVFAFTAWSRTHAQGAKAAVTMTLSGRLATVLGESPVRGAAVRLLPIDSTRMSLRMDVDAAAIFVDSSRARFATSDSAGVFVVKNLPVGRYLFQARRIGFEPREGVLNVDAAKPDVFIVMQETSHLLAGMTITEAASDRNTRYLRDRGFSFRQHGSLGGHFLTAADIAHHNWVHTDELLLSEMLKYDPRVDVMIDGIPVRLEEAMNYPTNLIMAAEVYTRMRPLEFGQPGRFGDNRPLVVIWTFRP